MRSSGRSQLEERLPWSSVISVEIPLHLLKDERTCSSLKYMDSSTLSDHANSLQEMMAGSPLVHYNWSFSES